MQLTASASIFENVLTDDDGKLTFYRFVDGYTVWSSRANGLFHPLGYLVVTVFRLDAPEPVGLTRQLTVQFVDPVVQEEPVLYTFETVYDIPPGNEFAIVRIRMTGAEIPLRSRYRVDIRDDTRLLAQVPVPVTIRE